MDQNVFDCEKAIKRIKKILGGMGIKIIDVDNGILCKASKYSINILGRQTSEIGERRVCKCQNTSVDLSTTCPYKNNCNIPTSQCPLNCTVNSSCGGTSSSSNNANNYSGSYDCLFRIKPSDIQNGIVLHAIILHGISCEFKNLFPSNKDGINELISTLLFLIQ